MTVQPGYDPAWRRNYARTFEWEYGEWTDPELPPPRPPGGFGLIPIDWHGLPLNGGDSPSGLFTCTENVDGWLDSPAMDGKDAEYSLADGASFGPKTYNPREITITGVTAGPRPLIGGWRDMLAMRVALRYPTELAITDGGNQRTLTADVRADSTGFRQSWITPTVYRWQITVYAADPLLYERNWQTVRLVPSAAGATGRQYPIDNPQVTPPTPVNPDLERAREYCRTYTDPDTGEEVTACPGWRYTGSFLTNSATLINDGNVPAPVFCLYEGDLSDSRLENTETDLVNFAALQSGLRIRLATATLTATTEEGTFQRPQYILPGSRPMTIPPVSRSRWSLYATGYGSVTLAWRHTWL